MTHALFEAVHDSLWRDVLDKWFPACIRPDWGFHQHFDGGWNATDDSVRFLVFQARMTWVCATIASAGNTELFADHARHGVAMLERMRHQPSGAYRLEVDAQGMPRGGFARVAHGYGQAFAIYGLVAAAGALGDEASLEAAKGVFRYLETWQRDRRHTGYFELTQFAGPPVTARGRRSGPIGGTKTFDMHLHLFEAFIALYRLWPDPVLRQRLEDLIGLFTTDWWIAPGHVAGEASLDGRPIPNTSSCGHDLELAHLLLDAAAALGRPADPELRGKATALVDTALEQSWAPEGGFLDPRALHPRSDEPLRVWWVQAEGLASLAALYLATADPAYLAAIEKQWVWIKTRQIDADHGGWSDRVAADGRIAGNDARGALWKECYHEVRALLLAGRALGGTEKAMAMRPGM